jgi:hypothetical protein
MLVTVIVCENWQMGRATPCLNVKARQTYIGTEFKITIHSVIIIIIIMHL